MKLNKSNGVGLMIMVALIAILSIIVVVSARGFTNVSRQTQLRIDLAKAHYAAQAGIKQAIWNWYTNSIAADTGRRYAEIVNGAVSAGTNEVFNVGIPADYAFYTFDEVATVWTNAAGVVAAPLLRLSTWRIRNIHTAVAGTADNLIVTDAKVSWSPNVAGAKLAAISLNGVNVTAAGGPFATPASMTLAGTDAQRTIASNGGLFQNNTTYLQWDVAPDSPVTVTVQWTWKNGDSTITGSKSHEIVYWGTPTGTAVAKAGAVPAPHTFTVTCTGQVNQPTGSYFKVLKTVKAKVSSKPGAAAIEIMDWDEDDKYLAP